MKSVIIFDHPYTITASDNQPHHRSYSAAVAQHAYDELVRRGQTVELIDLHADHFDPVMHEQDFIAWRTGNFVDQQTKQYFDQLADADQIIFIFPIWWEVMPAMTKGFFDKVLVKGQLKKQKKTSFSHDPAIKLFTIAGTPTILYKLIFGNPITKVVYRGTFRKIGLKKFKWHNFNAEDQTPNKRKKELTTLGKFLD